MKESTIDLIIIRVTKGKPFIFILSVDTAQLQLIISTLYASKTLSNCFQLSFDGNSELYWFYFCSLRDWFFKKSHHTLNQMLN